MVVIHTSVPSFESDVKCAEALKAANPKLKIGMIGAKVAVQSDKSLHEAAVIDFVCRNEFDFTCLEIAEEKPWETILGLSYRDDKGEIHHNPDRPILEEMDALSSVIPNNQHNQKNKNNKQQNTTKKNTNKTKHKNTKQQQHNKENNQNNSVVAWFLGGMGKVD